MRVGEGFGQLRMTGDVCDEYSQISMRPYPYRSEEDLIERNEITNLNPTWSESAYDNWPAHVTAPPNPSAENEVYKIRRGMSRLRWNKAGPWNLNSRPGEGSLQGMGQIKTFDLNSLPVGARIALEVLAAGTCAVAAVALYRAVGYEKSGFWKAVLMILTASNAIGVAFNLVKAGSDVAGAVKGS